MPLRRTGHTIVARGTDYEHRPGRLVKNVLLGMEERARATGGRPGVQSRPGGGTRVVAELIVGEGPRPTAMTVRVLLADDHPLLREGVRAVLAAPDFEVVGEADSGDEVVALVDQLRPDASWSTW